MANKERVTVTDPTDGYAKTLEGLVHELDEALSFAATVRDLVVGTVNKITGTEPPQSVKCCPTKEGYGGIYEVIYSKQAYIRDHLYDIEQAISRL
jgi:hypothetical protein